MQALEHQAAAVAEIVARATVFYSGGGWRDLTIRPRWHMLLTGPTGSGKTAVASLAAGSEAVGATLFRVSAPSWMPSGAHNRAVSETISTIAEAVARNSRTLLAIDELEKLFPVSGITGSSGGADTAWCRYISTEIFDLLDGRWPQGMRSPGTDDDDDEDDHKWLERLTTKLQETVFILAVGTFQSFFDSAPNRRAIGFGAEINQVDDKISTEAIGERLPRELLNRFGSLVRIPELKAADYLNIARQAEETLPERLRHAFRVAADRRIAGAISEKKGVRFLEECIVDALQNLPGPTPELFPAPKPESRDPFDPCIL